MGLKIEFEVPGRAVPQARPASSHRGGVYRRFDPPHCKEYKNFVVKYLFIAFKKSGLKVPFDEYNNPVKISVTEYRAIPKSWSRQKRELALSGALKPVSRPDTDNILKGIKDALNGVAWKDDAQVVEDNIKKVYSDTPRVVIVIEYL